MNVRSRRPLIASDHAEDGLVVALTALVLIPLMAFAAMAIDFGSWYVNGNRIHKAADAAALAGVVWLPDEDVARSVALETAARNGYDNSDPEIDVIVERTAAHNLRVRIVDRSVPLYFASVVMDDIDIGRAATAEYVEEISMGSPTNTLGNDPLSGAYPNYWLHAYGNGEYKQQGDRYTSRNCSVAVYCTGGVNDEYDPTGYHFTVTVDALQAAPLVIELFDPVHHQTGATCRGYWASWLFPNAATQSFYQTNASGLAAYPPERYETGDTLGGALWCPGDSRSTGGAYEMTVIVREPDDTPFDDSDNEVLCWARFGEDTPANQGDFVTKLTSDVGTQPIASGVGPGLGGVAPAPGDYAFRDTFREWAPACTDTSPTIGDYLVTVRTNASASDPLIAAASSTQTHRSMYAMRAGFGSPSSNAAFGSGVSLSGDGKLPTYVNRPGGDGVPTAFYLARVTPQYAGERLQLDIFDVGDGSNIDISFQPDPTDASANYSIFPNCDLVVETRTAGTRNLVDHNCAATAANNNFNPGGLRRAQGNGSAIVANIEIPPDWTCNESDPFACWITVNMRFSGSPTDTTTWSAKVTGDPIHLID